MWHSQIFIHPFLKPAIYFRGFVSQNTFSLEFIGQKCRFNSFLPLWKLWQEVWPQQQEKWKPLLHLYWKDPLLYEKAEKFYFYNCEQIVLQTRWPEWSDFSFAVIMGKQSGYFTPGFLWALCCIVTLKQIIKRRRRHVYRAQPQTCCVVPHWTKDDEMTRISEVCSIIHFGNEQEWGVRLDGAICREQRKTEPNGGPRK